REREPAAEPGDALHLPAAENVGRGVAAREVTLARTERQLVTEAERRAVPLVVAPVALVGVEVTRVGGVVCFDLARAVVGVLRQLVVDQEEHAARVTLVETERQAVDP